MLRRWLYTLGALRVTVAGGGFGGIGLAGGRDGHGLRSRDGGRSGVEAAGRVDAARAGGSAAPGYGLVAGELLSLADRECHCAASVMIFKHEAKTWPAPNSPAWNGRTVNSAAGCERRCFFRNRSLFRTSCGISWLSNE